MENKENIFEVTSENGDKIYFKFGSPFMTEKTKDGYVDYWIDGRGVKEEYNARFPNVITSSEVEGKRQSMNVDGKESLEIGYLSLFSMDMRGENVFGILNTIRKKNDGLYSIIIVNETGFHLEHIDEIKCTGKKPTEGEQTYINKYVIYGEVITEVNKEEVGIHCLINEIKDKCNEGQADALFPKLETIL